MRKAPFARLELQVLEALWSLKDRIWPAGAGARNKVALRQASTEKQIRSDQCGKALT
jgi:hypothetical protein